MESKPQSLDRTESARVFTLFDSVCVIVGTMIGAGIFQFPGRIAGLLPSIPWLLGVWIAGGAIALMGALCFAELTTTYPDRGGDYGYLKRAYHRHVGFAFSWAAFWVIRPGSIGTLAMIFGTFASKLLDQNGWAEDSSPLVLAVSIVVLITALNWLGVVFSKTAQNALTLAKVIGILIVLGGALTVTLAQGTPDTLENRDAAPGQVVTNTEPAADTEPEPPQAAGGIAWSSFWLAMVFVMFTFGGWNDLAFVASEVRDPQKNLFRALLFGTLAVLAIYLLVNLALLAGLGLKAMASHGDNASAAFVGQTFGRWGASLFNALVCVSCLGGINAMIFTSPRIYWATSQDYPALAWLAGTAGEGQNKEVDDRRERLSHSHSLSDSPTPNPEPRTPNPESPAPKPESRTGWWRAMALQCVVTVLFMIAFGNSKQGIDNLVNATAPYFWLFLAMTVFGLIINRFRYAGQFQGFRVPLYPLPPLLFMAACGFMMYQAWSYLMAQGLGIHAFVIGAWVVGGGLLSLGMKTSRIL